MIDIMRLALPYRKPSDLNVVSTVERNVSDDIAITSYLYG